MTERMLVVLDEAAKAEVPPGWGQAAPDHRIVPCPPGRASVLLREAEGAKPLADVLAGGQLVPVALRLAERYPEAVRSVLLVGPDPEGDGRASREWFAAHGTHVASARGRGRGRSAPTRPGRRSADRTAGGRGGDGDAGPAPRGAPPGLV
ncbi:MAG TPA: hypothetical protein VGL02_07740, partial [Streptomyces sp.]